MPAGVPLAPGRVPEHHLVFVLALCEPQHEIRGVLLPLVHHDPGSRPQLLLVQQGELPVVGKLADVEIDVAPRGVGESLFLQPGDQVDHFLDMLGGLADDGGHGAPDETEVPEERPRVEVRDLPHRLALLPGALEHLVFALVGVPGEVTDIGDVHHVTDLEAEILEGLSKDVLDDIGAEVAHVGVVVHGEAAAVHSHPPRLDGGECLQLPAHGVPEFQLHDQSPPWVCCLTGACRPGLPCPVVFRP